MTCSIAVVGATGVVGVEMLKILDEEGFPRESISVVASKKSVGRMLKYGKGFLRVEDLETFDFSACRLALFSPGAAVSAVYAPKAVKQGCVVVDNTSFFRMHDDVPLVVPEINISEIGKAKRGIIANPNCTTIQLVMALKPIMSISPIRNVFVSTYQSVSGAGGLAVDRLMREQVEDCFNDSAQERRRACVEANDEAARASEIFTTVINKNLIPKVDTFLEDEETKEERKMFEESRKILNSDIFVSATCVRVPVEVGHSESVFFDLERSDVSVHEIYEALNSFPGVQAEKPGTNRYQTPREIAGTNDVFVSRLRKNRSGWFQMWVVADNLRKGAALNAIQIAQEVLKRNVSIRAPDSTPKRPI
jgi:aspartate-semialdehyde dehydrogenase